MNITADDLHMFVSGSPQLPSEKREFIFDEPEDSIVGRRLSELYRKCEFPLKVDWGTLASEEQNKKSNREVETLNLTFIEGVNQPELHHQKSIKKRWHNYLIWVLALAWGVAEKWDNEDDRHCVQTAIERFRKGANAGRFPSLHENNVWRIIISLTRKDTIVQDQQSLSSAMETAMNESFETATSELSESLEFADQLAKVIRQCVQVSESWDDSLLQQVAALNLENHHTDEIAKTLHEDPEFIAISLRLIRREWIPESDSESDVLV